VKIEFKIFNRLLPLFFSGPAIEFVPFQLPCLNLNLPEECAKERGMAASPFASSDDDDDDWGKDDWGNDDSDSSDTKAETGNEGNSPKEQKPDIVVPDFVVSLQTYLLI